MNDLPARPACRRTVLRGAALAGAAGTGLTACGSSGFSEAVELGSASEIPVGGAKLYPDARVVVSRPAEGAYQAFSAVCTHQGCVCDEVDGTQLRCGCHGSVFNAETGVVEQGPATKSLPAVGVAVKDGKLVADATG